MSGVLSTASLLPIRGLEAVGRKRAMTINGHMLNESHVDIKALVGEY